MIVSPTNKLILRNDTMGSGFFLAPRKGRPHFGCDFKCTPNQHVYAPINGEITRQFLVYGDSTHFRGIEIQGWVEIYQKHIKALARLMYVDLCHFMLNQEVKAGDKIAYAQNIRERYGATMLPHVHCEIYLDPMGLVGMK